MPELPEVETIRNYLRLGRDDQQPILGMLVQSADVMWTRSIAFPTADEFKARIAGQTILEVERRGKYLILVLSDNKLLIHLRMSGDLAVRSSDLPFQKHDRIVFHLDNRQDLAFNDARKFGRAWLVGEVDQVTASLGPEPFDISLTPDDFYARLNSRQRQLKTLLLDQHFIAGLGNIYTDEALHMARLHPLSLSNKISHDQSELLLVSIRSVLEEGIRSHGASIDWVYRGGDFQNNFRVYQRTGLRCPECDTTIEKMIIGQRSTHYCPRCQIYPE
jgi:formamidopyrimidine-DNA glycosylase